MLRGRQIAENDSLIAQVGFIESRPLLKRMPIGFGREVPRGTYVVGCQHAGTGGAGSMKTRSSPGISLWPSR